LHVFSDFASDVFDDEQFIGGKTPMNEKGFTLIEINIREYPYYFA
jgi:hypothetical protein